MCPSTSETRGYHSVGALSSARHVPFPGGCPTARPLSPSTAGDCVHGPSLSRRPPSRGNPSGSGTCRAGRWRHERECYRRRPQASGNVRTDAAHVRGVTTPTPGTAPGGRATSGHQRCIGARVWGDGSGPQKADRQSRRGVDWISKVATATDPGASVRLLGISKEGLYTRIHGPERPARRRRSPADRLLIALPGVHCR